MEEPVARYEKNVSYKEPTLETLLRVENLFPETYPAKESTEKMEQQEQKISADIFDPESGVISMPNPETGDYLEKYRNDFVTNMTKKQQQQEQNQQEQNSNDHIILRPMKEKVKIVPFRKGCAIVPKSDYVEICNSSQKNREKMAAKFFRDIQETEMQPVSGKTPGDLLKDAFREVENADSQKYGNVFFTEAVIAAEEAHSH